MLKKKVDAQKKRIFVKEREVWFAHVGVNVGNEQDGRGKSFQRPVLIVKKVGNMFFVVPMTTGGRDNRFYYTLSKKYFGKTSRLILSQARFVDSKRCTDKIGVIDQADFQKAKEKLRALIL